MTSPRAGTHYPRSLGEFRAWFGTDADCLDYLESAWTTLSGSGGLTDSPAPRASMQVDGVSGTGGSSATTAAQEPR